MDGHLRAHTVDPLTGPQWAALVERSPGACIFHHPAWLRLLRDQYGYELYACCVADEDDLVAGLPIAKIDSRLTGTRLVALPFSDICPPLLANGDGGQAMGALAAALAQERRRTGLELEIHDEVPGIDSAFVQHRFYHHVLPLSPDVAEVERGFSKSQVMRGIKKARREGLTAERRTDPGALDAFYALHVATRRRQGMPTQPKRFIRRFAGLFDQGLGFVMLVHIDGTPVAGAVFLTFNGTITYKYGASDVSHLDKRPNNLLFMEAIEWACENGFGSLDFGRTPVDNEGLRSFKSSWGASETELAYTSLTDEPPSLDTPARNRVMGAVITRSPPGVGRLVGEAFYKHFG